MKTRGWALPLKFKLTCRTTVIASMVAIILTASASNAWADHTPEQLENAGYICFNAGPLNLLVCFRDRHLGNPAVPVKVFSEDGLQFLGTETLLREDIYAGQPCPQDGIELWDYLGELGLPYFGCHHFNTGLNNP